MNLPKGSSYKSVLKVYTLSKILLWIKPSYFSLDNACFTSMRATLGACIKPGCLARRPLCHKVNLPASCKGQRLLCHKVNLPASYEAQRLLCHKVNLLSCVARRPLFHKVNLPRCEARRHHFIMTCDIFGTGQTNILARQVQKSGPPVRVGSTRIE